MMFRSGLAAVVLVWAFGAALMGGAAAHEGGSSPSLLRDAEIETDIHIMMTPIWKAAGLDPDGVHVYLVSDDSINSFVAGGQNIFINSGLLLKAQSPNQLIGVLAHETGHILGGDLYTSQQALHNASIEQIIAMAAAMAATVADTRPGDETGAALLAAPGVGQRPRPNSRRWLTARDGLLPVGMVGWSRRVRGDGARGQRLTR